MKQTEEKISKHEDIAMKVMADFFVDEILPALQIEGEVEACLATESIRLDLKKQYQDFNFLMKDGTIKHFEFQSTNEGAMGLKRFRLYEADISLSQKKEVTTYVLFSGRIKKPMTEIREGINTYRVVPILLQNRDADQVIGELRRKTDEGEELTKEELLPLCLSLLMGGSMSHKERVMAAYDITRRAAGVSEEVIRKVEAVLYVMADKFLKSAEMQQLKEEIKMTRLGQMLFEDGRAEGRAEGERSFLAFLVKTKYAKGKSLESIADEVETDVETVEAIVMEYCTGDFGDSNFLS